MVVVVLALSLGARVGCIMGVVELAVRMGSAAMVEWLPCLVERLVSGQR